MGIGLIVINGRLAEPPDPPSRLLKQTREAWIAYWSSPMVKFVSPQTDAPALVRLFTLYDERARAYIALRKGERVVTGSKGQPVLSPLYSAIATMDPEIRQIEDRFGLSPRSRLQLGVVLGDAARSLAEINADLAQEDDAQADEAVDPRLALLGDGR